MPNYYLEGQDFTHASNASFTDIGYLQKIFGSVFKTRGEIPLRLESLGYIPASEYLEVEAEAKLDYKDPIYTPCFRAARARSESESKSSSVLAAEVELVAHKFDGVWIKFNQPISKKDYESEGFFANWADKYVPHSWRAYSKVFTIEENVTANKRDTGSRFGIVRKPRNLPTKRKVSDVVLKLCSDYASCLSNFFCFHWNRHHQASARMIAREVERNKAIYEDRPLELAKLIANEVNRLGSALNKKGSFKRRMDFLITQLTDGKYLDAEAFLVDFPSVAHTTSLSRPVR